MILETEIQKKIDGKTKPIGALGALESIAKKVCTIQDSLSPKLINPTVLVFAGDHGIANSGVSAYPQEVTYQMVMNFLNGGAAINVFCKQHGLDFKIIDAGVNFNFQNLPGLMDYKVGFGTKNFLEEPAMTSVESEQCLHNAEHLIQAISQSGTNLVGFGEMGIGNTSSASMLMHKLLKLPIEDCVGKGTGIGNLQQKINILNRASKQHKATDPIKVLQTYAGFEIATMVGAMIEAAKRKMIILVDGFISSSAYLAGQLLYPKLKDYALFCHQSNEKGHQLMLARLEAQPILKMDLRLGEGTGCALAYPLIQSAIDFINQMASFESAGVSKK